MLFFLNLTFFSFFTFCAFGFVNLEVQKAIKSCTLSIVSSGEINPNETSFYKKNPERDSKISFNHGTGFYYSENQNSPKYILTNFHVIEDALKANNKILACNHESCFEIKVKMIDKMNDLAMLYPKEEGVLVCKESLTMAENFNETTRILVYGNKLGLGSSFSDGIVASKNHKVSESEIFHLLDANVGYGNSGSPVFLYNTTKIIGVLKAVYSASGSSQIAFVLPIETVKSSINRMKKILELETVLEFEILEDDGKFFFNLNNNQVYFEKFEIKNSDQIQSINGKFVASKPEILYDIYRFLESEDEGFLITYASSDKKLKNLRLKKYRREADTFIIPSSAK